MEMEKQREARYRAIGDDDFLVSTIQIKTGNLNDILDSSDDSGFVVDNVKVGGENNRYFDIEESPSQDPGLKHQYSDHSNDYQEDHTPVWSATPSNNKDDKADDNQDLSFQSFTPMSKHYFNKTLTTDFDSRGRSINKASFYTRNTNLSNYDTPNIKHSKIRDLLQNRLTNNHNTRMCKIQILSNPLLSPFQHPSSSA